MISYLSEYAYRHLKTIYKFVILSFIRKIFMDRIFQKISEGINENNSSALCIVVNSQGSTPRKAGAKMIVYEDGQIDGTIGGGSIEKQVIVDALAQIKLNSPLFKKYNLAEDLGMHCGGKMEIYIEPLICKIDLFIFGAGHIGRVIARYSLDFGFQPTLIDERPEVINNVNIPNCNFVNKNYLESIDELHINQSSYIVLVTHKHKFDEDILAKIGKMQYKYLGMIGSKNKIAIARKRFINEKLLSEKELNKVDMPIGIKFNAQTPEEIAISIIAKLIDVKNS
ncbi:MAG: hypothetical protein A2046_13165 [Bacteroidetes bacterium GWA2_30_7]|nr:MAG: hypothetical protein A2046_13165 [Bacteroidetes bacterium GWA2_30_7]